MASIFEIEFHLDSRQFNNIVLGQLLRLIVKKFGIQHWVGRTFYIGYKISVGPTGQHRNLYAGLAQRGQIFDQLQLLASVRAREYLYDRFLGFR